MILSRKRSDRRDRRLCRFGVMLVICSLLVNMVCVPKAKAVVIDATAAFGAAAATAAINGTTATTLFTGMTTSAATSAMTGLMGEYAVATGAASSGTALAASIGAGTVITAAGAIVLTAAASFAVYKFIEWLREEKGLEAGGNEVVLSEETCLFLNSGEAVSFVVGSAVNDVSFSGTIFQDNIHYFLQDGTEFYATPDKFFFKFPGDTSFSSPSFTYVSGDSFGFFLEGSSLIVKRLTAGITSKGAYGWTALWRLNPIDTSLSLQPNPEFQTIPQEIPDGQAMVISGIENLPQDDPQAAADLIMQTAIDGNLSPTVTVEADPTATPEPEPEPSPEPEPEPSPDPDAPELPSNLGDLGAALTTRFPFSIPWDIARAINLIAAPAQAPYWEVDFLAPMAHWVGGFSGSTKVVLDFGKPEYEIIGIASRWTSTIGFCLALAAATKRFIWTA